MNSNFLKVNKNLKIYLFSLNNIYLIIIFSNKRFYFKKIKKKIIKLVLYFNYIFFFSSLLSILKFFFFFFLKLINSFNYNFKRILEARGRGYKFLLKFKKRLYLFSELDHLFFFNFNIFNYNLIKYNILEVFTKNFFLLQFFIQVLGSIMKKDVYKGKGFFDLTKKLILKLGKRSEYLR